MLGETICGCVNGDKIDVGNKDDGDYTSALKPNLYWYLAFNLILRKDKIMQTFMIKLYVSSNILVSFEEEKSFFYFFASLFVFWAEKELLPCCSMEVVSSTASGCLVSC